MDVSGWQLYHPAFVHTVPDLAVSSGNEGDVCVMLNPILIILSWWFGLFWLFSGMGLLLRRALGLRCQGVEPLLLSFWLGWVGALGLLQIWHFWLKVDGRALLLLGGVGAAGLVWNRHDLWDLLRRNVREQLIPLLAVGLFGVWLANRATGPILHFDTGLYHMTSVKWATTYPIVPGLGNVHGRLAFNSSFFLYAAMLNAGAWVNQAHHLANGLLLFVLLGQTCVSLAKLRIVAHDQRMYQLYHSLLFAPVLLETLRLDGMFYLAPTNLSPDVSVFALGIMLSGQGLAFLGTHPQHRAAWYHLFWMTLVACVGITIKLSFVVLAGTFLGVVYAIWLVRQRAWLRPALQPVLVVIALCGMTILVPWVIRGIILSGYPAYPSAAWGFPVEWRIPRALVLGEANWVRSWSRQPWVFWSEVLSGSKWLKPWMDGVPDIVIKPVELTLLALVGGALCCGGRGRTQQWWRDAQWLFFLPPVIALVFWFVSAPSPRFAGGLFWIVAAGALALMLNQFFQMYNTEQYIVIASSYALCIMVFLHVSPLRNPLWMVVEEPSKDGLAPVPTFAYEQLTTDSGMPIYIPLGADQVQCWDAPLPCAPDLRSTLRLRVPGDLSQGFILDKPRAIANTVDILVVPDGFTVSSDLGIVLISGWYDFEPKKNMRWMISPGKILLYTEHETSVRLSLTPEMMNTNNTFGNTGVLTITVNDNAPLTLPVGTETISEVLLHLRPDFNVVQFELVAGNFVPAQTIPGQQDARSLSIAFREIAFVTVQ